MFQLFHMHLVTLQSAVEMKIQFRQLDFALQTMMHSYRGDCKKWYTLARRGDFVCCHNARNYSWLFCCGCITRQPCQGGVMTAPCVTSPPKLLTTDSAVWKYFPLVIIPTPLSPFISLNVVVGGTTIYVQSVSWDGMDGWECCYIVVWAQSMFSFAGDHMDSDSQRDLGEAGNRIIFP